MEKRTLKLAATFLIIKFVAADFSLRESVRFQPDWGSLTARDDDDDNGYRGAVNGGGPRLHLESYKGRIALRHAR